MSYGWCPDVCPVCGKQLKSYMAMKQHCRAVHLKCEYEGEFSDGSGDSDDDHGYCRRDPNLPCHASHCDAVFHSVTDLHDHMSVHHPCVCLECGKECANARGRAQHMITVHGVETRSLCALQEALASSKRDSRKALDDRDKADEEVARLKKKVAQLQRDYSSEQATSDRLRDERSALETTNDRLTKELDALRRSINERPKTAAEPPVAVAAGSSASEVPLDAVRTAVSATSVMSLLGKTLALVPTLQEKAHEASNARGPATPDSVSFAANHFLADQVIAKLRQKKRKEGVAVLDSFLAAAAMFLGLSSLDAVLQSESFELLYHGTEIEAAKQILKFGFDPSERDRQAYGAGEYFCTDLTVAKKYTKDGIVVVSIVLEDDRWMDQCSRSNPSIRKVHNPPRHAGATFCLPIGVIGATDATRTIDYDFNALLRTLVGVGYWSSALSDVPKPEMTGRFGGPISAKRVDPNARADKYYFVLPFGKIHGKPKGGARYYQIMYKDDHGDWEPVGAEYSNAVASRASLTWTKPPGSSFDRLVAKETLVTITANSFRYEVDLARMSQRNLKTGKVREIKVDVRF